MVILTARIAAYKIGKQTAVCIQILTDKVGDILRKYHMSMSGVEHIHMMRRVPRSYDMTRTHIMHKGVNKHVDVVLRCSPKHWKKKKVSVTPVKGERRNGVVNIRVHAAKGYVAVRKVTNEKYEADRKKVVTAYETKYGGPSANGKALIHDMRSQLASMAGKSAEYIDKQLGGAKYAAHPEQPKPPIQPQQAETAEIMPEFPQIPETPVSASMLSSETEDILKKGGYRRPKPLSPDNPYASDYLKQASDIEFRSLMESLEKSLDEACGKYSTDEPVPTSPHETPKIETHDDCSHHENDAVDFSLNFTRGGETYAASEPSEDGDKFKPALKFSGGGEHYIQEDELFSRNFESPARSTETERKDSFNTSRFFTDQDTESTVAQANSDGGDFAVPRVSSNYGDAVEFEQAREDHEEDEPDFNFYTDEGGSEYVPPTIFPDEDEEFTPPTVFPDEDEEFAPPTVFPDEDEEFVPPTVFPDEDEDGYSPPPVSPDRIEYSNDGQYFTSTEGDTRGVKTLLSRAGGQIKKAIGVIRGSRDDVKSGNDGSYGSNDDVEITYSDRNN